RERCQDIPALANQFVPKHGAARQVPAIAAEALEAMMSYGWPGNVRELENAIKCAAAVARAARADTIRLQDLPGGLTKSKTLEQAPRATLSSKVDNLAKQTRRDEARQMMRQTGGNGPESARRLGISESYLYRLLRQDKSKEEES